MGDQSYLTILYSLGTAFFFGLNPLLIKKGFEAGGDPTRGTFHMLLFHSVSMVLFLVILGKLDECPQILGRRETVWLALAGVSSYVLGIGCYFGSIARLGASRTASIVNGNPVVSVVFAVILLRESANPMTWAGIVLILVGAYLVGKG